MAKNDCSTMDASSVGLEEEEDEEIELSLGLSIGRNFKKSPNFEPEMHKTANADVDLSQDNQNLSEHVEDPQRKREVHALRRQEARRKRENEAKIEGREGKKRENTEERGENSFNGGQNLSQGSVPVVPYPPLQFVPLANGFVYPCINVVPCLGPAESKCGKEKKNEGNVIRPFGCASLWPCQGSLSSGNLVIGGSDFERNGGRDGGNRNAVSNGSPVCVSPGVSENQSSSQQGKPYEISVLSLHLFSCFKFDASYFANAVFHYVGELNWAKHTLNLESFHYVGFFLASLMNVQAKPVA